MSSHEDAFYNWFGRQPRGRFKSDAEAYQAFYRHCENKLHTLNQSATLQGQRAQWAFRRAQEECRRLACPPSEVSSEAGSGGPVPHD